MCTYIMGSHSVYMHYEIRKCVHKIKIVMKNFKFKILNLKSTHRTYFVMYIEGKYSYRYKGTLGVNIKSSYIRIKLT
jgi:hypothetical protein